MVRIDVCTSREGFLALESGWRELTSQSRSCCFYSSFDWYHALFECSDNPPDNLKILCVYNFGELVGLLPMCLRPRTLRFFSYRCLELIGTIYSPVRGGLAREGWEEIAGKAIAQHVYGPMSREWDIFCFDDLPSKDLLLDAFKRALRSRGTLCMAAPKFSNVVVDFERFDDSQSFYSSLSRNLRRSLGKRQKRLTRDGTLLLTVQSLENGDVDQGMLMYQKIYRDSWKGKEAEPAFHRNLAHHLHRIGALRLFLLYYKKRETGSLVSDSFCIPCIKGDGSIPEGYEPVASRFVVVYMGKAYALKTAYKQTFAEYSVGSLLMWFVLRHLLDVEAVSSLDFQKGGEAFKYDFQGTLNDVRERYTGVNSQCLKGRVELLFEMHAIPLMRKIRNTLHAIRTRRTMIS